VVLRIGINTVSYIGKLRGTIVFVVTHITSEHNIVSSIYFIGINSMCKTMAS